MEEKVELTPYHNITIKYRIKLPDPVIISKEDDEKFLYSYVREQFELSKAALKLESANNLFISLLNFHESQFFLSYVVCLNLFLYRRFRIKKNFSRVKSMFRSVIYTIPFYLFLNDKQSLYFSDKPHFYISSI